VKLKSVWHRSLSSMVEWHSLGLSATELRPDVTLTNGQCFHWQPHRTDQLTWTGVVDHNVITIKQTEDDTLFALRHPVPSNLSDVDRVTQRLHDYFHVTTAPSLSQLYTTWKSDARFDRVSKAYPGLRLIRQQPLECVLSFICSSNNHISRITGMLNNLRRLYGTHLCDIDIHSPSQKPTKVKSEPGTKSMKDEEVSAASDVVSFYAFPTLEQLSRVTEAELREPPLNFGYRAKYIVSTVDTLRQKGGESWLNSLRGQKRDVVEKALTELSGVGPKVASCCALFSMDSFGSVPVDVHVLKIAQRDYADKIHSSLKKKTMNKQLHDDIAEFFRTLFGEHAGWAHSVLFCADLASFKNRLVVFEQSLKIENVVGDSQEPVMKAQPTDLSIAIKIEPGTTVVKEEYVLTQRESRRLKRGLRESQYEPNDVQVKQEVNQGEQSSVVKQRAIPRDPAKKRLKTRS